ncbi:MAG: tetraacyldisaccharide 4'-kinase [Candidatus Eisenbacteria bacterium]
MKALLTELLQYLEEHEDSLVLRAGAWPLLVLSWAYGLVLKLRWLLIGLTNPVRVPCAVVSVGNITVGGTGKTPLTAWLAQFLDRRGFKVAVVGHGYGARRGQSFVLLRGAELSSQAPLLAGDEAALLSRVLPSLPVASGSRKSAVLLSVSRKLKPHVVLMDDAFQSILVRRDLDIVLIDATNPWGKGYLLPRGRLREPKESLSRADIVVLTRCNQASGLGGLAMEIESLTTAPIVRAEHVIRGLWRLPSWTEMDTHALERTKVFALSGIANPLSFEETLSQAGAEIVGAGRFPDHHFFSGKDLARMREEASAAGAQFVIATEKDALRFPEGAGFSDRMPALALGVRLEIVAGRDIMERMLLARVERRLHRGRPDGVGCQEE